MSARKLRTTFITVFVLVLCFVLFACAPQENTGNPAGGNAQPAGEGTREDPSGTEPAEAAAFTWTADADCSMCHANSVTTLASLTCAAAQGEPNGTCMTCHSDTANVELGHAEVTMADTSGDQSRLRESRVTDEACLTCHAVAEMIQATADFTGLTDREGLTINPHEASTVHNVNGAHDGMNCVSCHKMHSDEPLEKRAQKYCLGCHHDDVYACNTCH